MTQITVPPVLESTAAMVSKKEKRAARKHWSSKSLSDGDKTSPPDRSRQRSSPASEPTPSPPAEFTYEAVLHDQVAVPEEASTDLEIKNACLDALMKRKDDVVVEHTPPRCGNPTGLSKLQDGSDLKALKRRFDRLEAALQVTQLELQGFKDRERESFIIQDSQLQLRNRYIAKYLKDVIGDPDRMTEADHQIIREGDAIAHHGEPLTDAVMWKRQIRTDLRTFKELYLLNYHQVLGIYEDKKSLKLLAIHSTLKTDTRYATPPGLKDRFFERMQRFIEEFEVSDFKKDYLLEESSRLAQAYYSVWDAVRPIEEHKRKMRHPPISY